MRSLGPLAALLVLLAAAPAGAQPKTAIEKGSTVKIDYTLKDDGNEVSSAVEAREVKAALVRAVDELPQQERTVISLYYFEGLTLKEIKGALNVSESRVSQIHAQAVIHLRTKLKALKSDLGYRDGDPNVKQKYTRRPPAVAPGEPATSSGPTSSGQTGAAG